MGFGKRKRKENQENESSQAPFGSSLIPDSARSLAYHMLEALEQSDSGYVHLSFNALGLVDKNSFIIMLKDDFIKSENEKSELKSKVASLHQDLNALMGL